MISSRTIRYSTALLSLFASTAILVAVIYCSSSVTPSSVRAEDMTDDETDPDFIVPAGTPDEIRSFIAKLHKKKVKFANQHETEAFFIKREKAGIRAADMILAQKPNDKVAANAVELKLTSLTLLAANEVEGYAQKALDAVTTYKSDERPLVAKVAKKFWPDIRIINAAKMTDAERNAFADELIAAVVDSKFSESSLQMAVRLGYRLGDQNKTEEAGAYFDRLAKVSGESSDENIQKNVPRFEGIARRMRLPGHFMDLKGKLLNGDEFDWASYRGKVVLVDFWATWCGPCIAELPNVKANYKKYHDKGFEVVGISLDKSREPLDRFIQKEELPWSQLFDENLQKEDGWSHPMVQYYGINAIPSAILLDKDGKVVSMAARGDELPKLLEKLLGKAE